MYFSGGGDFQYHNDVEKTSSATNACGWRTMGGIGRLDDDGYLYPTDRKDFVIISGGVNIYPQEIENLLVSQPEVADAAVFGATDEEYGERVVAVVQPLDGKGSDALAGALRDLCRRTLGGVKTPKQIDFCAELPRHATGKLYKRLLRDEYRAAADSARRQPIS